MADTLHARAAAMADRAVQKTDDDAASSKVSAVLRGYYSDDLLNLVYTKPPTFRLPLINIGTYCRVQAINREITRFLDATKDAKIRKIVSLGAGSDTRPFHLLPSYSNLHYYELDFPVKTRAKQSTIDRNPRLKQVQETGRYNLISADLRKLTDLAENGGPLSDVGNDDEPVLVISECCLCYLPVPDSDRVLHFFGERVSKLAIAAYEPMSLNDEFGRVMAQNMASRGLVIPTLMHYSTKNAQQKRFRDGAGLDTAEAVDIYEVYTKWLTKVDRERIARLEFLDEVEEMHLLMNHYCIAWGSKGLQYQ